MTFGWFVLLILATKFIGSLFAFVAVAALMAMIVIGFVAVAFKDCR